MAAEPRDQFSCSDLSDRRSGLFQVYISGLISNVLLPRV
ncbi:hypothetical protein BN903_71 [Halorubrum sp. AJ67]|nr:hypothetical protein BN903_71 [Halorubrum sp. AJ67]